MSRISVRHSSVAEVRLCDHPECGAAGDFRAPRSPRDLGHHYWFCLEHVRAYNASWNYFEGMSQEEIERYQAGTVLLDTWHPDRAGGTGLRFDWSIAARLARKMPVILAGGLTPANVVAAVAQVRPWAIDISSSVESAPGQKDRAKMWELADALAR